MDAPRIQYAKTADGVDIAFTVFGQGAPLVSAPGLAVSHLQMEWDVPYTRAQLDGLAERATVVRYDPRGVGMSQRDAVDFSPEAMVLDLDAVVNRLGLERFALFGRSLSGNIPFVYAARRQARVSHLVLLWRPFSFAGPQEQVSAISPLMEEQWELFTNIFARLIRGWDSPDATLLASQFRATHSPQSFRLARKVMVERTPEAFAHDIKAPTLIMHNLGDSVSAGMARTLASQITGAQVAGIPGLPHSSAELNAVAIAALHDFISTKPAAPGQPIAAPELDTSTIKTILFTDIEEHTSMMQRLGDERGRDVLREHERITREALQAHGGAEIKTIGDSFMASFPSAQKSLECAIALQQAFESQELCGERLRVRVGINAGEPIAEEDDLFGSSVILAARAARQAQGGEILVTDVVRQLVTGKGFLFADRGEIELRGFEDPVRLYEVRWRENG
jgi:class 3 adenylate cyclase/pimeloyl-ACP methyl ester carboxylesterase